MCVLAPSEPVIIAAAMWPQVNALHQEQWLGINQSPTGCVMEALNIMLACPISLCISVYMYVPITIVMQINKLN